MSKNLTALKVLTLAFVTSAVVLFCTLPMVSYAQTIYEWQGSSTNIRATHFISNTKGWAVGEFGLILTTSNGGMTWTVQNSATGNRLNSVYFISANQGWAVGEGGVILTTSNGGIDWTIQSTTATGLRCVYFISATKGWATGNAGAIWTTSNGGTTWTPQNSGTSINLRSVFFSSATQGWAVGEIGVVRTTSNGGITWTAQTSGSIDELQSVYFISATQGWIVGANGTILTSTNGGTTWTAQNSRTPHDINSIYFISATQGWAVGRHGTILTTNNGGVTWTAQISGTTNEIIHTYFLSPTQGWAVGNSGSILTTSNGGNTWIPKIEVATRNQLYDIAFVSTTKGWTVGVEGTILTTDNGGVTWTVQNSGIRSDIKSIHFISPTQGWIAGNEGTILTTTNGGITWTTQVSGTWNNLTSIYFTSAMQGWAVGEGGTIRTTSNGGVTWTTQISGTISNLRDVYFISNTKGWAVGEGGLILTTSNGGITWTSQTSGTTRNLNSVYFTSATQGWAVGASGVIRTTSNGGTTWTGQYGWTSQNFNSVYFISANQGWAVGESGTISTTSNGGVTWRVQPSGTMRNFNSVAFASTTLGCAVGAEGIVFSTENGGNNWVNTPSWTKENLYDVFFISSTQGWMVGWNGVILTTTNGGATWSTQASGVASYLTGVYFISPTKGWVVGTNGTILSTSNGGNTWTRQISGVTAQLNSIYFISETQGWAVGINGTILTTSNGGTTWTAQANNGRDFYDIHFISATQGWVVGNVGTIMTTSNGGITWTAQTSGFNQFLSDVHFISATQGWAVGGNSTILTTSNGGITWTIQFQDITNSNILYSVCFISSIQGWAVGGGRILTTSNGGVTWTNQGYHAGLWQGMHINGGKGYIVGELGICLKFDASPIANTISGNAFADGNNNCTKETGEVNLKGLVVKATPGNYYGMTDANGNYTFGVPTTGTYQVELLPQNPTGGTHTITAVCPPKTVNVTAAIPNVTGADFGAKAKVCSQLTVNVSINRFRRCFEGNTYITYKNIGLLAANSVEVKVELPPDIDALSSIPAWTSRVGNVLTYNIGTLAGQSEGTINLRHLVVCGNEAIRGQSRCIKATISPATYCTPLVSPTWDNADLTATATCVNQKLGRFTIKNEGTGDMADSSSYRIFFDNVIVRTGKVKLRANEEFLIDINNTRQFLRLEVEQTPMHPTGLSAMAFFNRCGDVPLSAAFNQQLPNLTNIATGSACETIRDSYDPNDKRIMPAGVTAQTLVEKDQDLEFQIRFQNTGNDEAYTVVVRDTLDQNLDLATIRTIATSHTSTVSMEGVGQGIVIWTFNNINLPAKSVNEAASIGVITFRIRMKPNLPIGTTIKNKAGIYFDFNSPIITNEAVIKIGSLPTDFGNPAHVNTIFPCPTLPSVAVAGANQNISTSTSTLAATPIVKGYGQWTVVQGTATFADQFSPTSAVSNLSNGLNILKWTSYLCNNTSESQMQIMVALPPCTTITLNPANLPNATTGTAYLQTITQTGGVGAITYSISAGSLPTGLTLNASTGEISGTPTVANTFNFTVEAKDVNNCVGTKTYTIQTVCPAIAISPNSLPNGTLGTAYAQTITQVGGIGAITYAISSGTLPNGLTLNASTGEISGTPTVANTFNFTVEAKDVNNCTGTKAYTIQTVCPTIAISPNSLSNGTLGTAYSQTLTQTGGVGAITYAISAGTLPTGLTLNASTGEISGTPTVANTFSFTVEAKDVNNCVGTKTYTIQTVCPAIAISPNSLPNGTLGTAYSQTLTQTGGVGAITYAISLGTLPTGLTLNASTGEISGTPTVANTFNFTVEAKDVNNCTGTKAYTIQTVCPAIAISPNSLPNGTLGTAYAQTLTQVGGIGAITYSISTGSFPNGLTLNTSTGLISGTPTVANTFSFTVEAKDVNNCTGTKAYTIQTVCPAIAISPNSLPNGTLGTAYAQTLTQVGGIGAITYAISLGTLPTGLTLNASTGLISGMPTVANTFNFTVEAKDVNNCVGTKAYALVANPAPVPPPPPTLTAQTITFAAPVDVVFGSPAFTLVATASSGLPVSFVVLAGANNVFLGGNSVTTANVGEVTIEARQTGNASFAAATPVQRTFRILPVPQRITGFDSIPDRAWNSGNFFLNATTTSGTQPIYTVTAGQNIATIATGSSLVVLNPAVGRVTITAFVPASGNYAASTTLTRRFNVVKADQKIDNVNLPTDGVFGQLTTATVSATATSKLPITTVVTGNATLTPNPNSADNTLTINGAGTITLTFAQAGNDLWNEATSVTRSFVVEKANQTISFIQPLNTKIGVPINLQALASSGLPVLVSVISGTATVNGSRVIPTSGGELVLELTQEGNENFNAAPVSRVKLIAIPNITVSNLLTTRVCSSSSITINYNTDGNFPAGNIFIAYLSDANGNFNNALALGSVVGTGAGSIVGTISADLPSGVGYRIQIRSTLYGIVSNNSAAFGVDKLPDSPTIGYATNGDLQVTVPMAGLTLQWVLLNANGTTTPVVGATSATFTPTANGNYQLQVSNNGCTTLSKALTFGLPVITASNDFDLETATEIYPNPHEGSVNVKTVLKKSGLVSIEVTDVLGKTVYTHTETAVSGKYEHQLALDKLASGVYVITLRAEDKAVVKKTVKQ